jgi:F0F1-type ATP synthase epsilon subunit
VVTVRAPGGKSLYFAVDGGVLGVDKQGVRVLTGRAAACATLEAARAALIDLQREK